MGTDMFLFTYIQKIFKNLKQLKFKGKFLICRFKYLMISLFFKMLLNKTRKTLLFQRNLSIKKLKSAVLKHGENFKNFSFRYFTRNDKGLKTSVCNKFKRQNVKTLFYIYLQKKMHFITIHNLYVVVKTKFSSTLNCFNWKSKIFAMTLFFVMYNYVGKSFYLTKADYFSISKL